MIHPFKGLRPLTSKDNASIKKVNEYLYTSAVLSFDTLKYISDFIEYQRESFIQDMDPCYYIYQIESRFGRHRGLVALLELNTPSNNIYPHEEIIEKKSKIFSELLNSQMIQANPIILLHTAHKSIKILLNKLTQTAPDLNFDQDYNENHKLWVISDSNAINTINKYYESIDRYFIADGHHRYYAALKDYNFQSKSFLLSWLIPDNEMNLLPCHWIMPKLHSIHKYQILNEMEKCFDISLHPTPFQPQQYNELGIYLDHNWYKLKIRLSESEKYSSFALNNLLNNHRDLEIISIQSDVYQLTSLVDKLSYDIAFSLPIINISDVLQLIYSKRLFPASTTYFYPKPVIGLITYSFNPAYNNLKSNYIYETANL